MNVIVQNELAGMPSSFPGQLPEVQQFLDSSGHDLIKQFHIGGAGRSSKRMSKVRDSEQRDPREGSSEKDRTVRLFNFGDNSPSLKNIDESIKRINDDQLDLSLNIPNR
jgi:hypothetical protein